MPARPNPGYSWPPLCKLRFLTIRQTLFPRDRRIDERGDFYSVRTGQLTTRFEIKEDPQRPIARIEVVKHCFEHKAFIGIDLPGVIVRTKFIHYQDGGVFWVDSGGRKLSISQMDQ